MAASATGPGARRVLRGVLSLGAGAVAAASFPVAVCAATDAASLHQDSPTANAVAQRESRAVAGHVQDLMRRRVRERVSRAMAADSARRGTSESHSGDRQRLRRTRESDDGTTPVRSAQARPAWLPTVTVVATSPAGGGAEGDAAAVAATTSDDDASARPQGPPSRAQAECDAALQEVLASERPARLLAKRVEIDGKIVTVADVVTIQCSETAPECGTLPARAFYGAPPPGITVCSKRIASAAELEETLVHELIHAFDHCIEGLDLTLCDELACSEIRAARDAECGATRTFLPFGFIRRNCARNTAARATSTLFGDAVGNECVQRTLERCYGSPSPYDSEPDDGGHPKRTLRRDLGFVDPDPCTEAPGQVDAAGTGDGGASGGVGDGADTGGGGDISGGTASKPAAA